jgi:hypothetical protein
MIRTTAHLALAAIFTLLVGCAVAPDLETGSAACIEGDGYELESAADYDLPTEPDAYVPLHEEATDDEEPQTTPEWDFGFAAPLADMDEAAPMVFAGDYAGMPFAAATFEVPAEGLLRADTSYCGADACKVWLASDKDGDGVLDENEVVSTADSMQGEAAEAWVEAGEWTLFVAPHEGATSFIVELLWSNPGGSDGTAS